MFIFVLFIFARRQQHPQMIQQLSILLTYTVTAYWHPTRSLQCFKFT